jgi:hypothetical protein
VSVCLSLVVAVTVPCKPAVAVGQSQRLYSYSIRVVYHNFYGAVPVSSFILELRYPGSRPCGLLPPLPLVCPWCPFPEITQDPYCSCDSVSLPCGRCRCAPPPPLYSSVHCKNRCNISHLDSSSSSTPGVFYKYLFNHARRLRLEKLLSIISRAF